MTDSEIKAIEGWFSRIDMALFRFFLSRPAPLCGAGDLAELGVYLGKSAVLIGSYQQPGETFSVVDLFGMASDDPGNARENEDQYGGLSQGRFERNYRSVHADLPVVIRGVSSAITTRAAHGTHRFVHVDASHLYEQVRSDLQAARTLLRPQGIVAVDDIQSQHTPGVAAAVWQEVAGGLSPLVISPFKLYGTWGSSTSWQAAIGTWVDRNGWPHETQLVSGHELVRVWERPRVRDRWLPPAAVPKLRTASRAVRRLGRAVTPAAGRRTAPHTR